MHTNGSYPSPHFWGSNSPPSAPSAPNTTKVTGVLLKAISQDLEPACVTEYYFTVMLGRAASQFRLNEMEVAAWHSSLQTLITADTDVQSLSEILWVAAYHAKMVLAANAEEANERLKTEDPDFKRHYDLWLSLRTLLGRLTLQRVNQSYIRLLSASRSRTEVQTAKSAVEDLFNKELAESVGDGQTTKDHDVEKDIEGVAAACLVGYDTCQDKQDFDLLAEDWADYLA